MTNTLKIWQEHLRDSRFRYKVLLAPAVFMLYSAVSQKIGNFIESRPAPQLHDALLQFFPAYDFSLPIFILLYGCISLLFITHLNKPNVIVRVIELHFYIAIIRQLCILMVPLSPPEGMIVLKDVFLENTVYPHNSPLTKDLFFSGHVASIYIYYVSTQLRWVKRLFFWALAAMIAMIMSMKFHYSIDIIFAIIITRATFEIISNTIKSPYLKLEKIN